MKTKQGREIRMAVFDLDGTLLTTDMISDADRAVRTLSDGRRRQGRYSQRTISADRGGNDSSARPRPRG